MDWAEAELSLLPRALAWHSARERAKKRKIGSLYIPRTAELREAEDRLAEVVAAMKGDPDGEA